MKAIRKFVALFVVAAVAFACSDDEGNGNGPDPLAALAGNYTTTKFEYAAQSDPDNINVDLIAIGGSLTVNLAADGSFSASLTVPLAGSANFTGNISISGTVLTFAVSDTVTLGPIELLPEDPFTFDTYALSGNTLTLSSSDVMFDFLLGAGTEVPATLLLIMTRS